MFSTLTEKLIVIGVSTLAVLVGVFGFIRHERNQGAAVCIQQQSTAAAKESAEDTHDAQNAVNNFNSDLSAITVAASHTPSMLMCDTPSVVHTNSSTRSAKPAAPAIINGSSGMQAGTESRIDIGPALQDITLVGMLCSADVEQLWSLAVKEAQP